MRPQWVSCYMGLCLRLCKFIECGFEGGVGELEAGGFDFLGADFGAFKDFDAHFAEEPFEEEGGDIDGDVKGALELLGKGNDEVLIADGVGGYGIENSVYVVIFEGEEVHAADVVDVDPANDLFAGAEDGC